MQKTTALGSAKQEEMVDDVETINTFLINCTPKDLHPELLDQFESYFKFLFKYLNNGTQDEHTNDFRVLVADVLALWLLRSFQWLQLPNSYSGCLKQDIRYIMLTQKNCNTIFQFILDFWGDGGTALANATKNLTGKLLKLIKVVYMKDEVENLLKPCLVKIAKSSRTLRGPYYLLEFLHKETDLSTILEISPGFIDQAIPLLWSDSLSNPVGKAIAGLLKNVYTIHHRGDLDSLDLWFSLWKPITVRYMQDSRYKKSIELYILTPLFRDLPIQVFKKFAYGTFTENPTLLLSTLSLGQDLGIEAEPFLDSELLNLDQLEGYLQNDALKLEAFKILTSTNKKSKIVPAVVLDMVKRNLKVFFVETKIEVRNYFSSFLKHFIIRIRDSGHSLNRDLLGLKRAGKYPREQEDKAVTIQQYHSFLAWMIEFIKSQIVPGSQYQRNALSFKVLNILIESGLDSSIPPMDNDSKNKRYYPFNINLLSDALLLRLVIDQLSNSYDDIRTAAKHVLKLAHMHYPEAISDVLEKNLTQRHVYNALDKYQTSDIGAAIGEFLFTISDDQASSIQCIIAIIDAKIGAFDQDFIKEVDKPIGGYFTLLGLILEEYDWEANASFTGQIVEASLGLAKKGWESVKDILCFNSSNHILPAKYANTRAEQVVISYAFKSVKEVSVLLKSILDSYPLSVAQIRFLGDLLIEQLFDIRHSGAFQAILPTFTSCCNRCQTDAPELLSEWLNNILTSLEVKTQHITRRSGGMPFLLTTILSTEKDKDRPLLSKTFHHLLGIVSVPVMEHQDQVDVPQVNAFNCIKGIFIESKLSSACVSYIPEVLKIALHNFDSELWAIRNCSIMLFTSLQNRLFGKMGKNTSARLFFTRYNGIRETLSTIFKNSLHGAGDNQRSTEGIFLVLNILVRLKPTQNYEGLEIFESLLIEALASNNWKVRELAARAIACLSEDPTTLISALLSSISLKNQNKLHGHIMAIRNLMVICFEKSLDTKDCLKALFHKSLVFITQNNCFVTVKSYIETLKDVLDRQYDVSAVIISDVVIQVRNFALKHEFRYAVDGTKQLCLATCFQFLLEYENHRYIDQVCEIGINSYHFEVQLVVCKYIQANIDLEEKNYVNIKRSLLQLLNSSPENSVLIPDIVAALQTCRDSTLTSVLLELIIGSNSEQARLAALECVGDKLSKEQFKHLWGTVREFLHPASSEDLRLAALTCVIKHLTKQNNMEALLAVYGMLYDDSETIRQLSSSFICQTLIQCDSSKNPVVTAYLAVPYLASSIQDWKIVFQQIQLSIDGSNRSDTSMSSSMVFEHEKDNLFVNDIEQQSLYMDILQALPIDKAILAQDIETLVSRWCKYIKDDHATETSGPFTWSSDPDTFSKLAVLVQLVVRFTPTILPKMKQALQTAHVHPALINSI